MKTLIIKLGATGDVVRTTTLLNVLKGEIDWVTTDRNLVFLNKIHPTCRGIPWSRRNMIRGNTYDLVINLEDATETAELLNEIDFREFYGAYLTKSGKITYTDGSKKWFDLSIISRFGKEKADELKHQNRKTYQELIFEGLGYRFDGQKYLLPESENTDLSGDIAIAPKSGTVWPMKNWAYFSPLKKMLEQKGFTVNVLPQRDTFLEHIGDIQNHQYLISGDSLPMHIAMGSNIKCLTIFICTSPWEIYGYGLQRKVVSPYLKEYFYKRDFDSRATTSISVETVFDAVQEHMRGR